MKEFRDRSGKPVRLDQTEDSVTFYVPTESITKPQAAKIGRYLLELAGEDNEGIKLKLFNEHESKSANQQHFVDWHDPDKVEVFASHFAANSSTYFAVYRDLPASQEGGEG